MKIYWTVDSIADLLQRYPSAPSLLTAKEAETYEKLTVTKRQCEWLAGRIAIKELARKIHPTLNYLEAEVRRLMNGKPWLAMGGEKRGEISISHSGRYILAAYTENDRPIGVDLEKIEPRSKEMIETFFTTKEANALSKVPEPLRQFAANLIWSAKEAILKMEGCGLSVDTRSVEVTLPTLDELVSCRGAVTATSPKDHHEYSGGFNYFDGYISTIFAPAPVIESEQFLIRPVAA